MEIAKALFSIALILAVSSTALGSPAINMDESEAPLPTAWALAGTTTVVHSATNNATRSTLGTAFDTAFDSGASGRSARSSFSSSPVATITAPGTPLFGLVLSNTATPAIPANDEDIEENLDLLLDAIDDADGTIMDLVAQALDLIASQDPVGTANDLRDDLMAFIASQTDPVIEDVEDLVANPPVNPQDVIDLALVLLDLILSLVPDPGQVIQDARDQVQYLIDNPPVDPYVVVDLILGVVDMVQGIVDQAIENALRSIQDFIDDPPVDPQDLRDEVLEIVAQIISLAPDQEEIRDLAREVVNNPPVSPEMIILILNFVVDFIQSQNIPLPNLVRQILELLEPEPESEAPIPSRSGAENLLSELTSAEAAELRGIDPANSALELAESLASIAPSASPGPGYTMGHMASAAYLVTTALGADDINTPGLLEACSSRLGTNETWQTRILSWGTLPGDDWTFCVGGNPDQAFLHASLECPEPETGVVLCGYMPTPTPDNGPGSCPETIQVQGLYQWCFQPQDLDPVLRLLLGLSLDVRMDAAAAANARVYGTLYYTPPGGGANACGYCIVFIWDQDKDSADDPLGSMIVDRHGNVDISVNNKDCKNNSCGGVDPYFVVDTRGVFVDVVGPTDDGLAYYESRTVKLYQDCSASCNVGSRVLPTKNDDADAFLLMQSVLQAGNWFMDRTNVDKPTRVSVLYPWEMMSNAASQTSEYWQQAEHAAYYPGYDAIGIGSIHGNNPFAVAHEYGHHLDHYYGGAEGQQYTCNNPGNMHYFSSASDESCALREGWAHFFASQSLNMGVAQYALIDYLYDCTGTGASARCKAAISPRIWNMESGTCLTSSCSPPGSSGSYQFAQGASVEGRVAMTFFDLMDSSNDGYDNAAPYQFMDILTILATKPAIYTEFHHGWSAVHGSTILVNVERQNTIYV